MDPRFDVLENNLIGKDIKVQLENLDMYLEDRIYNIRRKELMGKNLKQVIRSWDDTRKHEVIEMYIAKKPSELASIIDWFDIKDSNKLLDIANRIIDNNGYICGNIDKFHIQDETIRINIAKSDLGRMPNMLMKSIDKFNITNQDAIMSLAKMGFLQNEYSFCENFAKFNIQDERQRVKFAMMLLNVNLGLIPPNIQNFNISNQDILIAFAEDIARRSYGNNISRYIKNFNIQDEKERIEIAKIIAHKKGSMIVQHIKKYDIHDKVALLEILEEAAITDENCREVALSIDNFGLKSLQNINNIFNIILSHEDNEIAMISKINRYIQALKNIKGIKDTIRSNKNLKNAKLLHEFYSNETKSINFDMKDILGEKNKDSLIKIIQSQKEERTKNLSIEITEKILFAVSNLDFKIKDKDSLTRLIIDFVNIRSLKLKKELLPLSVKLINDNGIDKISQEIEANNKKKAYPALYSVLFSKMSLYDGESDKLLLDIRKAFGLNSFLKDSKVVQNALIGLIKLERTYILEWQKKNILRFIVKDAKSLKNNFRYLSLIIEFGTIDMLENITPNSEPCELKDIFHKVCRKYLGLDNDDQDFIKSYESFVTLPQNEQRNLEECIMTYIAARNYDEEVIDATRKFIKTMSDIHKFRDMRYDTTKSVHLLEIQQKGEIYTKWISGEHTKDVYEAVVSDDPVDLFLIGTEVEGSCQSVFYQDDLNSCLMGYVIDGKNKAVVVKNEHEKIMARCIIRLLIEKDSNNVVMVREKLYKATGVDDSVIETINKMCVDYAKWLGISVVCIDENLPERYTHTLVSKGGQAPAEYVDVLRSGVLGDEEYQVQSLELAYLYKQE